MYKIITAFTAELDDPDIAVSEISEQIEAAGLLKNSVGILTCHADCVSSGVVEAVCAALPFDTVGTTTLTNMSTGSTGSILLTLFVITGDDVLFSVGLANSIAEEDEKILSDAYNDTLKNHGADPSFLISFAPLLMTVGCDFFVEALTRITGGLPNFGTVSVDHTLDYRSAWVIHKGKAYSDRYAFVIVSGIKPKFIVTSISAEKSLQDKGVVTAAKGNQLISVNNISVLDYFIELGILKNDPESIKTINSYPFIVNYGDGTTPVVRNIFAFTPDGAAVCGGNIPIGSQLKVGSIDAKSVVLSTEHALAEILATTEIKGLLMFSCVGRYYTPGFSPVSEMEKVRSILEEQGIPYQYTISGGEICPVYVQGNESVFKNRNHNDTIVFCVF